MLLLDIAIQWSVFYIEAQGKSAVQDAENIGQCTMQHAVLWSGIESLRSFTHRAGYWQRLRNGGLVFIERS